MLSSIVLAAGMSTRMGEPKALLNWHGQPLIRYQVEQLQQAGVDEVIVVLGHRADDIQREMRPLRCRVLLNPRFQMGKAGSLRIGARGVNRDAEAIVIVSVDQPRTAAITAKLVEAFNDSKTIVRAAHNGQGGHPIIVPGTLRDELIRASDGTGGLKGVIAAYNGQVIDVEAGPECLIDLNTPADLEAARATAG